ncbi:hypothetical protein BpHYR1_031348, partial [Brachionus plicatilis]
MVLQIKMDEFHFAVKCENGRVKFFNQTLAICTIKVRKMSSFEGRFLAAGTSDGEIYFWNYYEMKLEIILCHYKSEISSLLVINDTYLISASTDGSLKVWILTDFSEMKLISNVHGKGLMKLKKFPNDQ